MDSICFVCSLRCCCFSFRKSRILFGGAGLHELRQLRLLDKKTYHGVYELTELGKVVVCQTEELSAQMRCAAKAEIADIIKKYALGAGDISELLGNEE